MAMRDVQELVGRRVKADLGADGVYVGELLELTGTTWQGRMRITGVIAPAQHQAPGGVRRGHRPGEFVEVGQTRLVPTGETGHETYLAALAADAGRKLGSHSGRQASPHGWVFDALARSLRAAHLAEEHRLLTGNWRLVPDESLETA